MSVFARCVLALILVNLVIVGPLFTIEYTVHMGSIEAAFIAISHQWMKHGVDFGWWPLWYGGIPGQNTYPPLLHLLVAWTGSLLQISAALSHHVVTAAAYVLCPVTAFWLARVLGAHWTSAFAAGLLYSVTCPAAWLVKAYRHYMGSPWNGRRLHTLIIDGEGPHLLSLMLIPLGVIALHYALTRGIENRRDRWMVPLAGLALASVVLTNWLGGFGLAAAALCYLFLRPWKDWVIAGAIGAYAYILASPWIPPTTLKAIRTNAQWIGGDYRFGVVNAVLLVALIVLAANASRALRRFGQMAQFGASYFILVGGIVLLVEWGGVSVLPQPHRYQLELDLAACLLLGAFIPKRPWAIAALTVLCLYPAAHHYKYARRLLHPIDVTKTSEYHVAQWLDKNAGNNRVFVSGATSYWLNSFNDVPQIGGGFDQGLTNNILPGAQFQIMSGMGSGDKEGEVAVAWLKALGVHAAAVAGPGSTEPYKPISNPKKFDGILQELWRDGGDIIYRVPQRSASLARAVPKSAIPPKPPTYLNDVTFLTPYLVATSDPAMPEITWKWLDRNHAVAEGNLQPEHAVSLQISYHPGWRATANGNSIAIVEDGIGQMALQPNCSGPCRIELGYTREISPWAAFAAALLGAGWAYMAWRRA